MTRTDASAARAIPDDNLAYPVLITLKSGSTGSGFFLNTATASYLVTARHVIFSPEPPHELLSPEADLLCYSKDPKDPPNRFHLDLARLKATGQIKMHLVRDVAVIRIARVIGSGEPTKMESVEGVAMQHVAPSGVVGVALDTVKRYEAVLIANDVIVFGYPTSLGLKSLPQLDASRPLLRKGMVAGLNDSLRSIILDCQLHPGNSGGPVLEAEPEGFAGHRFHVIGVVSQFVPSAEIWFNTTHGYANTNISNSGYSVATPMDFVLELIDLKAEPAAPAPKLQPPPSPR